MAGSRATRTIGTMREEITIETRAATQDGYGEPLETWSLYRVAWADIQNNRRATDLEQYVAGAGKELQRTTYSARIYYDATITPATHRVQWAGKTYDIEQVFDADGSKQFTELRIKEV